MKPKLLIVDDNLSLFKVVIILLEKNGYEVRTAIHGEDAIEVLKKYSPDLILLDVMMPVMDGYELCRYLKNNSNYKSIPIIFLTANNNRNDIIKGFELGASDYINKPIIERELILRINTHVDLIMANRRLKDWNYELVDSLNDFTEEFNKSKEMYYSLLNNLPIAIIRVSEDGSIIVANFAYFSFVGLDVIDYKNFISGKIKLKYELTDEVKSKIDKTGFMNYKSMLTHKTGKYEVAISAKKVTSANNTTEFYDLYIENINSKIENENFNKKLLKGIDQVASQVVFTDINGNVEYVNSAFTRVTGYSSDEIFGKNIGILKSGYMSKSSFENMWETILQGNDWKGEFFNKKKDGSFYWETSIISPIRNELGEINGFIAVKDDITELKKIQEEIHEAKKNMEEASNLKNAILQNLSHELTVPLNSILDSTELLKKTISSEGENKLLDLQYDSTKNLLRTLETVVKISQYESNIKQLNIDDFDLFDIIKKVILELSRKAEQNNVFIQDVSLMKECKINSDDLIVEEIIYQIIDNSIKFSKDGIVTIEVMKISSEDKKWLSIVIHDSGIGIESAKLNKIFEAFRQLHEGASRKYEGLGLGLSLVKTMVEIINGEIYIDSTLGEGTTITLNLPIDN